MEKGEYFKAALGRFVRDVSDGGAIRHLTDLGLTAGEISKKTTFSLSEEEIGRIMWEHLTESGVIRYSPYEDAPSYRIIREQDKYGRNSFRRVEVLPVNDPEAEYLSCDFGIRIKEDKTCFLKKLEKLEQRDKDYILSLPWPDRIVYYRADERMKRILSRLSL